MTYLTHDIDAHATFRQSRLAPASMRLSKQGIGLCFLCISYIVCLKVVCDVALHPVVFPLVPDPADRKLIFVIE